MQSSDRLVDDHLQLGLIEEVPGVPATNHMPAYKFKMTLVGQEEEIGHIQSKRLLAG